MTDGKKTKAVRCNCDADLIAELDSYRTRFYCRTQMIEQAIKNYLELLKQKGVRKGDWR